MLTKTWRVKWLDVRTTKVYDVIRAMMLNFKKEEIMEIKNMEIHETAQNFKNELYELIAKYKHTISDVSVKHLEHKFLGQDAFFVQVTMPKK